MDNFFIFLWATVPCCVVPGASFLLGLAIGHYKPRVILRNPPPLGQDDSEDEGVFLKQTKGAFRRT